MLDVQAQRSFLLLLLLLSDHRLYRCLLRAVVSQSAEYRFLSSLNVLNVVQSGIMFLGISLGVIACTAGVAKVRQGGLAGASATSAAVQCYSQCYSAAKSL